MGEKSWYKFPRDLTGCTILFRCLGEKHVGSRLSIHHDTTQTDSGGVDINYRTPGPKM